MSKGNQGDSYYSPNPKDNDLNVPGTTNQAIENTVSHILFEIAKPYSEQNLKRTDLLLEP